MLLLTLESKILRHKKYVTLVIYKYYIIHAKSPHTRGVHEKSGGFVNAGGWGTRKNSVHFPRGVHAARQKHAPCVGLVRNRPSNTTHVIVMICHAVSEYHV